MDGVAPRPHVEANARAKGPERGVALRWQALEYEHRERSVDWFWMVGIIAVAAAAAALILENVLFALLIIIGAFVIALYAMQKPEPVEVELSPRGVRIGKTLYPYHTLDSFWVFDDGKRTARLIIDSKKFFQPELVVPLQNVDAEEVHTYLLAYLDEEEKREPFSHILIEKLGL